MRALISLLAWAPSAALAQDLPGLLERVQPAVLTLQVHDAIGGAGGNGTGFLVREDGWVVTNFHVAAVSPDVAVGHDGKTYAILGMLAADEEADLALLRIEGTGHPYLSLGAATPPKVRDRVLVVGSPFGFHQTVTEGEISAIRPDGPPPGTVGTDGVVPRTSLLQINADIAPGSSGSPVLTPTGEVIGVAQSANMAMDTYFAVDASVVKALVARAPPDGTPTPLQSPARQAVLALAVVAGVVALVLAPGGWAWLRDRLRDRASRPKRPRDGQAPVRFPGVPPET